MSILIKGMDEIPEDGAVLVVRHDNGKAYIKHACTYGYSMELVELPAIQPDHNADIGKKVEKEDCVSRQAAIDAVEKAKMAQTPDGEIFVAKYNAEMNIQLLPPVQPVLTCKGCRYDGYYKHMQCRNCLRKERDLYEPE